MADVIFEEGRCSAVPVRPFMRLTTAQFAAGAIGITMIDRGALTFASPPAFLVRAVDPLPWWLRLLRWRPWR